MHRWTRKLRWILLRSSQQSLLWLANCVVHPICVKLCTGIHTLLNQRAAWLAVLQPEYSQTCTLTSIDQIKTHIAHKHVHVQQTTTRKYNYWCSLSCAITPAHQHARKHIMFAKRCQQCLFTLHPSHIFIRMCTRYTNCRRRPTMLSPCPEATARSQCTLLLVSKTICLARKCTYP
jgi:hypothetical protein